MDGEWVRDGDVARGDEGPTQERRETSCDVRWVGVSTLITAFVGKRGKEDDLNNKPGRLLFQSWMWHKTERKYQSALKEHKCFTTTLESADCNWITISDSTNLFLLSDKTNRNDEEKEDYCFPVLNFHCSSEEVAFIGPHCQRNVSGQHCWDHVWTWSCAPPPPKRRQNTTSQLYKYDKTMPQTDFSVSCIVIPTTKYIVKHENPDCTVMKFKNNQKVFGDTPALSERGRFFVRLINTTILPIRF